MMKERSKDGMNGIGEGVPGDCGRCLTIDCRIDSVK